jgi:DNA transformation protein
MSHDLQHCRNLGKTSVQWLNAVGIHSSDELRSIGAVAAYQRVRARGFRASRVLLYAIEGALLDIHWNALSTQKKAELNQRADNLLRDNTQ